YIHVYLEVDVFNVLDWTESLLVVQYPPSWEYVGQEIGTFFGDEEYRIGTVLTGIYGFCEAGIARIRPRENGSVSGSGWVETLEFKYLARLGGGGGGIDGNKTASYPNHQFWSFRRFCLNHATQVYRYQSFSGTTLDNQETEIYYQFVILREVNGGDYDNNTEFNISDITPIAMLFGDEVSNPEDVLDPATYVDGSCNYTVDIADFTPLAMFFGHKTWATLESLYRVEGEHEISYELWQFVKFFERCPPNIYLPEGSHPWVHPAWYYHVGETGMYIAHHTYNELYQSTWAYGTTYIDELVIDGRWVVSGDELGVAFQWTEVE
ncbi:hypothetical protein J7J84_01085, partial [bacterium]|nr:hypothetical protein [bacterium]